MGFLKSRVYAKLLTEPDFGMLSDFYQVFARGVAKQPIIGQPTK